MLDYYKEYNKVVEYLSINDCTVVQFSDNLPDDVVGRCYYKDSRIELNCISAKEALFTLLHEAGHWYSYMKYFKKLKQTQPNIDLRETYAYLYGWGIAKILKIEITKNEWKEYN